MEDAFPEAHPVDQIMEHKQELMVSAGISEEDFEVSEPAYLRQRQIEGLRLHKVVEVELPCWTALGGLLSW